MMVLRVDALTQMHVGERVDRGGRGRAVAMSPVAVASVVVHDEHAHDVQAEPDAADYHHLLRAVDRLDVDETLQRLEEY